jgi:type III secretion system FlhB-like substrate exporter
VVVTDGVRRGAACALRYDVERGDVAPLVLVSGRGDACDALLRAARAGGLPIAVDTGLAAALVALPHGEPIPAALYDATAEALRDARALA